MEGQEGKFSSAKVIVWFTPVQCNLPMVHVDGWADGRKLPPPRAWEYYYSNGISKPVIHSDLRCP